MVLLAALGVALLVVIAAVVVPRLTGRGPATVTVMTRNVYLGADINRPVRAARGKSGGEALAALGQANDQVRAIVDQTDFRVRSRLLAAEIAAARPDLVGLQEVALWRKGPLELDAIGVPNADDGGLRLPGPAAGRAAAATTSPTTSSRCRTRPTSRAPPSPTPAARPAAPAATYGSRCGTWSWSGPTPA